MLNVVMPSAVVLTVAAPLLVNREKYLNNEIFIMACIHKNSYDEKYIMSILAIIL